MLYMANIIYLTMAGVSDHNSVKLVVNTKCSDVVFHRRERLHLPIYKATNLEQWFERVCRIISGAARDYDAAYKWIVRVSSREEGLPELLKDSGTRFGQIDQRIAADMLKKCTEVKANRKADDIHRDIATAIGLENQKAHSSTPSRMMKGREMIFFSPGRPHIGPLCARSPGVCVDRIFF